MPLKFQCPACGKELQAPYAAAGMEGACTFCHARLIAPLADGQQARLAQPPQPPQAPQPQQPPQAPVPPPSPNPVRSETGSDAWRPPATAAMPGFPPFPGMPGIPGFPGGVALRYAPFWKRAVEFFIDTLIIYVLWQLLSPVVNALNPWPSPDLSKLLSTLSGIQSGAGSAGGMGGLGGMEGGGIPDPSQALGLNPMAMLLGEVFSVLTFSIVEWLYFATLESSPWQATLGKMMVGVKVTDLHGQRISFWRASGRMAAKGISRSLCFIGYLTAAFNEKTQALHDILAQTVVVEK